jgi:hypothetical protein
MTVETFTVVTGWALVVMLGGIIALPFLMRGPLLTALPAGARLARMPLRQRLTSHYTGAYVFLGGTMVHLLVPMMANALGPRHSAIGLWLATLALLAAGVQVTIGRRLRDEHGEQRHRVRRSHLAGMSAVVLLIAAHIVINGPGL